MYNRLRVALKLVFGTPTLLFLMSVSTCVAQWEIQEDIPLGSTTITYKPFRDAWILSFDGSTTMALKYTIAIPQLCVSSCPVAALNHVGLSCAEINNFLLDPAWFNEMAILDIGQHTQCPRSFGQWNEAQYLLGAVNLRSTVYMTMPTSMTIHNDASFLGNFDSSGRNSTSWALTFRILFITAIDIGTIQRFSVRLYVGTVILSKPDVSMATLSVNNACRLLGLLAPPDAHLKMHVGADKQPVCMWDCRIDAMRVPWNLYPETRSDLKLTSDIGSCRPFTKYFTAVEFLFILDTFWTSSNPGRLNSFFFDELNSFTSDVQTAIASSRAAGTPDPAYYQLMALSVPGSDFDTHNWHSWIRSFITFSHRNDVIFDTEFMNETILLDSLKTLGIYQVVENADFIHDASLLARRRTNNRRYATQAITVKGLFFTNDVTSQLSFFSTTVKDNILQSTHQFSPNLEINKPVLIDVRRIHRVALPSNETVYLMHMHRVGVYSIQIVVLLTIVIMMLFKTTKGYRPVWL